MMRGMIAALGTNQRASRVQPDRVQPGEHGRERPGRRDCYIRHSLINTGRRSRGRGECEAGCRTAGYSRGDATAGPALRSSAWDSPAVSACLAVISSYDTGCPPSII
jgi:hypothetical protein